MNSGKILLGVLAGIAIGAITGILFAPEKGSTTRKNIADKSDAYANKLGSQFKGFVEGMTEKFESMTNEAEAMAENGASKVAKGLDHMTGSKRV
jgi:gas vesicle protein